MFKRDDILYFVKRGNNEIVRFLVEKVLANGMVYVINPKNTFTYWLTDKDLERAFHTEIEAVRFVNKVENDSSSEQRRY